MKSIEEGLVVRAVGPVTVGNRIPLSELARIASNLQATLERIALSLVGARQRPGRRPPEIADAVRLDFVGFRDGSAVLELKPGESTTLDNLLDMSFATLSEGVEHIRATGEQPVGDVGVHFTPAVLNGLVTLCGGIGHRSLSHIEFITGNTIHFTLDRDIQAALRTLQKSNVETETTIVGRLHMGDFDPLSLRCRIDTNLGSVSCDFDIDFKDEVFTRLDQLVMATGSAEIEPDGIGVRIMHLTELSVVDTSRTLSLDELAREQGVSPLRSIDQLRGEPVENFELFLQAIRAARGDE
ncbi:hypothetical protein [Actinokineospora iranica]|uniref:Uncharacterized protein n=1 Tax=Actinokineospora iranica TaxID=1271860 RepID=A0A1G6RHL9_9PSEU|nr:hypothetical protein [Actinokineospora iranica]SDD03485.1 hypothetical protein SAMN05216174_106329 [Actinokineospora iranica]